MSNPSEYSGPAIAEAIDAMVAAMLKRHSDTDSLVVVSIANGGIQLGERIAAQLSQSTGREIPTGVGDITFHRDDIGLQPISKISLPTELPFSIDDTTVILVDDVLYSGRTVRAAINELFDQGRPSRIELAVLFHREDTRLPIQPDYFGFRRKIDPAKTVSLEMDPDDPNTAQLLIH